MPKLKRKRRVTKPRLTDKNIIYTLLAHVLKKRQRKRKPKRAPFIMGTDTYHENQRKMAEENKNA